MELIAREELARDARVMDNIRTAHHAEKRDYEGFVKKMRDHGR